MANYCCAIRTNYFKVKDENEFRALMNNVICSEDQIEVFDDVDSYGVKRFGFGCYGGICGLMQDEYDDDDYDQETDYDAFIDGLQKCVADDDAIIIFESGNEKLRYVVGQAEVITTDDYCVCNIQATACGLASEMMNNPTWKTRCAY